MPDVEFLLTVQRCLCGFWA